MKDWAWEQRDSGLELALFLHLKADFSRDSAHYKWFKALKLKHYRLYEGPFPAYENAYKDPVAVWLERPFYKPLIQHLVHGTRMSYADFYHYVFITPSLLIFVRAWGQVGTEESDAQIITELFDHGVELGDWVIQDLDYGNEWARGKDTDSFKTYLCA